MNAQGPPQLNPNERAAIVTDRVDQVRGLLRQVARGSILLDSRRDFAWLTMGGTNHIPYTTETGVAPILVTLHDALVLAPVNEFDRIADEEIDGLPLGIEKVAWFPGAAAERATEIAGETPLRAAEIAEELTTFRSVLRDPERGRMDWLAQVVNEVVDGALAGVDGGSTEDELIAVVSARFAERAVRLPVVLVAADERIARYRHPLSASAPIYRRVMLVVVAERWGLHVAHTHFRELEARPVDVDQRAQRLAEVLAAMRRATVPGNTLGHVLDAARAAYESARMPNEWKLHHQGGTIGYQARERIATPGDPTPIEAGMAFAWNPSAVGFKLEETLYLDAGGRQHLLTTTPL